MRVSFLYTLLLFFLFQSAIFSQVKIGEWTDHLNYSSGKSAVKSGKYIYYSNGSGLAKYNNDDNSVEKLTKINGLSDVGVKLLRLNHFNGDVYVIYENSNIDIIQSDEKIINFSDIKRRTLTGSKIINEIYFDSDFAYVSCGFGIIQFDWRRLEAKETFFFGINGNNLNIYQTSSNDTSLYAATSDGVYFGNRSKLLNNFSNWKKIPNLPNGPFNGIVKYNNHIVFNYSEKLKSNQDLKDTLYQLSSIGISHFPQTTFPYEISRLYDYSRNNKLAILDKFGFLVMSPSNNNIAYISNYGFDFASIVDGFYEDNSPNFNLFFLADRKHGLVKSFGSFPEPNTKITINGPNSNLVNDIETKEGNLYLAPTNLGELWNNQYNFPYMNAYQDNEWKSIGTSLTDSIIDINCVSIDPNDKNHVAFGSWGKGIVEVRKNTPTAIYNTTNSSLTAAFGSSYDARIGGIAFDKNSNLWSIASLNNNFLNVKLKNGSWQNFNFTAFVNANPNAAKLMIDKNDQIWIQLARGNGIIIYKNNGNFSQPNASNTKVVNTNIGSGALPSTDIFSMAEDLNGQVWVGTAKGICVFYNPSTIFSSSNWDSQQILIEQEGQIQILLEKEYVTAITVDGANRKWIGTQSSGVYCLSPDGQKEIFHFTVDNSPLYSNSIRDISIDEINGDVFIASEKGLQSLRTSIIKGFDDYSDIHVFPNPIRPSMNKVAYIKGLVDESIVKITDVAGNLVWETKSEGGQVEWNLSNLSGGRVSSGVYMIYCSTADGELKGSTKLLVVH
jgi:hypothetical protein